jgi:hypothetical protein
MSPTGSRVEFVRLCFLAPWNSIPEIPAMNPTETKTESAP